MNISYCTQDSMTTLTDSNLSQTSSVNYLGACKCNIKKKNKLTPLTVAARSICRIARLFSHQNLSVNYITFRS